MSDLITTPVKQTETSAPTPKEDQPKPFEGLVTNEKECLAASRDTIRRSHIAHVEAASAVLRKDNGVECSADIGGFSDFWLPEFITTDGHTEDRFAGAVASLVYRYKTEGCWRGTLGDYAQAMSAAPFLIEEGIRIEDTFDVVMRLWGTITAIARAVFEHTKLSANEVVEIYEKNVPCSRPTDNTTPAAVPSPCDETDLGTGSADHDPIDCDCEGWRGRSYEIAGRAVAANYLGHECPAVLELDGCPWCDFTRPELPDAAKGNPLCALAGAAAYGLFCGAYELRSEYVHSLDAAELPDGWESDTGLHSEAFEFVRSNRWAIDALAQLLFSGGSASETEVRDLCKSDGVPFGIGADSHNIQSQNPNLNHNQ